MGNDLFSLIPFALIISLSGFISGFVAGLLGVGGGIIVVPVLYHFLSLLGVPSEIVMHISVATSLAVIIPTGWRSYKSHKENNNIDQVINSFKPPIFWKDKNIIKQQIKIWELNDIESFIVDLNNTESLIKKNPQISNQIINNMILDKVENTNIQI